ncbi:MULTISPECIES: hypothetical protein [Enterobacteriaceae]|uniref:Uncharacterized protein n=3 Tax=Enterobacterales TaxID=91347 RepID=A0A385G011_KLEPN|nr:MULTISPECIES: hypothetical protein [Enterobacteriaceae]AXV47214.1 hypothetical protein [Klebsiella pneumoniae]MDC7908091.1 hypothetical protein [Escherichia coli]MDC7919464.1 hypothetical protein [Escherichia coli]MDD8102035.1 hypothetical protein [Escherichia coli]MDD8127648.1 hypothetical protein [Escherichia coli]
MTTLTFEIAGVKKLLEELRSAERFNATIEQLFEPSNYPAVLLSTKRAKQKWK